MKKILHILILIFGVASAANAQNLDDLIQKAYLLYNNEKDYEAAREQIDAAVQTKKGATSAMAWHIRGFIYKDIFASSERDNFDSNARRQAIESFKKSISLDENEEFLETNRKALNFLAKSYWNNASDIIDARKADEVDSALDSFNAFKEVYTYLHPDSTITDKEVQVNLALATAHRKIYEGNRERNKEHWDISNAYLMKVLDLDPLNWDANYSLGVSYYNKGAFNLERLPDIEAIVDIYKVQGESMQSIQGALSFMLKAYEIDPERIETVKGLKWITFNLHQYPESQKYDQLLEDKQFK
jgi:tetratricopeptide (TPR) repeat protein